jgi:hypothetical protein
MSKHDRGVLLLPELLVVQHVAHSWLLTIHMSGDHRLSPAGCAPSTSKLFLYAWGRGPYLKYTSREH